MGKDRLSDSTKIAPQTANGTPFEGPAVAGCAFVMLAVRNPNPGAGAPSTAGSGTFVQLVATYGATDVVAAEAQLDGTSGLVCTAEGVTAKRWYARGFVGGMAGAGVTLPITLELQGAVVPPAWQSGRWQAQEAAGDSAGVLVPQGFRVDEIALLPNAATATAQLIRQPGGVPLVLVTLNSPVGVARTVRPGGLWGALTVVVAGAPLFWHVSARSP